MCSVKSKDVSQSERQADWMGADSDRFRASLSSCLHAMGQPLTVLRCTAAVSAAQGIPAETLQRYLCTSAEQVQLLCCLFDCLRDLVDSGQLGGEPSPMEVSQLLSFVVEEQTPSLQASGLAIDVRIPAELHSTMLADMNRSLKALTSVLRIAASVSAQGDAIEVAAAPKNGGVELIVQNQRAHRRSFTALERVSLEVAEAIIRNQDGDFVCSGDPFCVSMTLPVQSPAHNRVLSIAQLKGKQARYETMAGLLCT